MSVPMSAFISIVLKVTMKFASILKDLTLVCVYKDTQEVHQVQIYVKVNLLKFMKYLPHPVTY